MSECNELTKCTNCGFRFRVIDTDSDIEHEIERTRKCPRCRRMIQTGEVFKRELYAGDPPPPGGWPTQNCA